MRNDDAVRRDTRHDVSLEHTVRLLCEQRQTGQRERDRVDDDDKQAGRRIGVDSRVILLHVFAEYFFSNRYGELAVAWFDLQLVQRIPNEVKVIVIKDILKNREEHTVGHVAIEGDHTLVDHRRRVVEVQLIDECLGEIRTQT